MTGVSTAVYFGTAAGPVAPRPASSVLDLAKIESTGYIPVDADEMLVNYVRLETRQTYESATG